MDLKESTNIDLEWLVSIINEGSEIGFKQYIWDRKKRNEILSSIGFSEILSSPAHGEIFDSFFKERLKLLFGDFKELKAKPENNSLSLYSKNSDLYISSSNGEYSLVYKHTFPNSKIRKISIVKGTKQEISKGEKKFVDGRMVNIDFEQMVIDEDGFVQSISSKGENIIERKGNTVIFAGEEYDWDGYPADINPLQPSKTTITKNIRETVDKYPQTQQIYERLFGKETVKKSLEEQQEHE